MGKLEASTVKNVHGVLFIKSLEELFWLCKKFWMCDQRIMDDVVQLKVFRVEEFLCRKYSSMHSYKICTSISVEF